MSSHSITNKIGREVRWGLDLPTGGFFYNEFYTEAELALKNNQNEELASTAQGLTLSELDAQMFKKFAFKIDLDKVVYDLQNAQAPTALQFNVSTMFGVNLAEKLQLLDNDLQENWN